MTAEVEVGDGVATIALGDTLVEVWRSPASAERWRWVQARRDRLLATRTEMLDLSIILGSSSPPNAALRSEMQADFKRMGPKMRRMVVVPVGTSVWISLVRAIVRGILLVSGGSKQQSVASSLDEGIERVRDLAGADTPMAAVLRDGARRLATALGETDRALEGPRA